MKKQWWAIFSGALLIGLAGCSTEPSQAPIEQQVLEEQVSEEEPEIVLTYDTISATDSLNNASFDVMFTNITVYSDESIKTTVSIENTSASEIEVKSFLLAVGTAGLTPLDFDRSLLGVVQPGERVSGDIQFAKGALQLDSQSELTFGIALESGEMSETFAFRDE